MQIGSAKVCKNGIAVSYNITAEGVVARLEGTTVANDDDRADGGTGGRMDVGGTDCGSNGNRGSLCCVTLVNFFASGICKCCCTDGGDFSIVGGDWLY